MIWKMLNAVLAWAAVALLAATPAPAATLTQFVAFEAECLDLDTGAVTTSCRVSSAEDPREEIWDVVIGYHADRAPHAVAAPNPAAGVEMAHLRQRSFDDVTAADAETAEFTPDVLDEPFDAGRVILVRTDRGAVYKLGRPSESDDGLSFDYELLLLAP